MLISKILKLELNFKNLRTFSNSHLQNLIPQNIKYKIINFFSFESEMLKNLTSSLLGTQTGSNQRGPGLTPAGTLRIGRMRRGLELDIGGTEGPSLTEEKVGCKTNDEKISQHGDKNRGNTVFKIGSKNATLK